MDQLLTSAVGSLEQVVCKGLGLGQPSTTVRNLKVKAMKAGLGQPISEVG
jgi:hypothetical protein